MPWSGSAPNKTFSRTGGATAWADDKAAGTKIRADLHDTHDEDIGDSLNLALLKDGGNAPTANLPFGGFKGTNVAVASARTEWARADQVADGDFDWYGVATGSAQGIIVSASSFAPSTLSSGMTVRFQALSANTSSGATLKINSTSALTVVRPNGAALQADDITAGKPTAVMFSGSDRKYYLFGLTAADTSNSVSLTETTAPSTAASEGALYAKDSGTQPELFYREESDGDEVQITTNGALVGQGVVETAVSLTGSSTELAAAVPSWATQIVVTINAAQPSGTDSILIQIGDSGGYETTGYACSSTYLAAASQSADTSTAGFIVFTTSGSGASWTGQVVLSKFSSVGWSAQGVVAQSGGGATVHTAGIKSLSAALTTVRLATSGSDTFSSGTAQVTYR